jgi:hypothetical protein
MGSQRPLVVIREMRPKDAQAFLEVHHAAVRGIAVKDYPLAVIEAWAPMPVTEDAIEWVRANPDKEFRAGRKGVGSALVKEIEHAARAGGAAFRTGLFPDRRVFLSNYRL